jgi:hypothetical protein
MATTYVKRPTYTSPKGAFKFPSLSKPDFGNEKFPKPDGEYKTSLIVKREDAQGLIDILQPEWDAAIKAGKEDFAKLPLPSRKKFGAVKEQPFFAEEFDPETEEETGNVIFSFKTKYKILDKKTNEVRFNKIGLFDAKGKPLAANTAIYAGTIGKIAFQASPYFVAGQAMAGISLRLSAAQVIDLVGPGARTATQYGFGQEEGYEAGETDEDENGFSEEKSSTPSNGNSEDF